MQVDVVHISEHVFWNHVDSVSIWLNKLGVVSKTIVCNAKGLDLTDFNYDANSAKESIRPAKVVFVHESLPVDFNLGVLKDKKVVFVKYKAETVSLQIPNIREVYMMNCAGKVKSGECLPWIVDFDDLTAFKQSQHTMLNLFLGVSEKQEWLKDFLQRNKLGLGGKIKDEPYRFELARRNGYMMYLGDVTRHEVTKDVFDSCLQGQMAMCGISYPQIEETKRLAGSELVPFWPIRTDELRGICEEAIRTRAWVKSEGAYARKWMQKYWNPVVLVEKYWKPLCSSQ